MDLSWQLHILKLLRHSARRISWFTKLLPSIIMVVGYSLAFYFLSLTLKDLSIGVTYAIWSGMGILLISLIGYFRYVSH